MHKIILSQHKTKLHQPKLPKVYMQATISILHMLIRVMTSLTPRPNLITQNFTTS